jgi:hypothetical protein
MKKGNLIGSANSGGAALLKGSWLKFNAQTGVGGPFANGFRVHWRVANADRAATDANDLRGEFYNSNDGSSRWEHLIYRGVHTVEAFVVRMRDNRLVGQSAPFYVVVE